MPAPTTSGIRRAGTRRGCTVLSPSSSWMPSNARWPIAWPKGQNGVISTKRWLLFRMLGRGALPWPSRIRRKTFSRPISCRKCSTITRSNNGLPTASKEITQRALDHARVLLSEYQEPTLDKERGFAPSRGAAMAADGAKALKVGLPISIKGDDDLPQVVVGCIPEPLNLATRAHTQEELPIIRAAWSARCRTADRVEPDSIETEWLSWPREAASRSPSGAQLTGASPSCPIRPIPTPGVFPPRTKRCVMDSSIAQKFPRRTQLNQTY